MFQNIDRNFEEDISDQIEDQIQTKISIKNLIKSFFTIQNIILYTLVFMISLIPFGPSKEIAPFAISMAAAILSSSIAILVPFLLIGIANSISFGLESTLQYFLIGLILFFSILIKSPRYDEDNNEKRKLAIRLFFTCLIVKLASLIFKEFIVYDLLVSIMQAICVVIFYKIFVNSIPVINKLGKENAYSIEEIMGASLMFAIAISSLSGIFIFGHSLKNILCILVVLIMGWKNGILIGGTAGIIVGTTLGVINAGNIEQIGIFAISGMIAGLFSRFGKIGVIVGFLIGMIFITHYAAGDITKFITIQEVLIASLGLLVIPKRIKMNIKDMLDVKLLPETTGKTLEENKETIYKLTTMSETISEIARSYKEAAATVVDEEELKESEKENLKIFEKELLVNIEGIEENILFDDLYSPEDGLIENIFDLLLKNEIIVEKDLINIFENHNNYIVINEDAKEDVLQMVKIINYSYRVSRLNFIWKKKLRRK